MRYAAVDVGSNSCRLLVAEIAGNSLKTLCRQINCTRLAEGVNTSSYLNTLAMERTINCLKGYKAIIEQFKVESYRAVATSAMRDARNRKEFAYMVNNNCGLTLEIISGEEEAQLSYLGVKAGLNLPQAPLVIDLGGGSCEFKLEDDNKYYSRSLPLGAVRATEAGQTAIDIKDILAPVAAKAKCFKETPVVFVGGTVTTLVAMKLSMEIYDPQMVHGQYLHREEIADLYNMLMLTPIDLRRRLPGLQPERADIIPTGALIVLLIMDALNCQRIIVSESDILEGIIRQLNQS
ncbi:MAG: Ppx/GppA family phosphatase [Syntrophomonadaceae bacterium]|jgi:exopolyphosphatase/guanosine-5'-triphosphate,3'-diphosphate pyrophosphatase